MSFDEIPTEALRMFDLLSGLEDDVLREVAYRMTLATFNPMQNLCHQAQKPQNVYFMTEGLALAYRRTSGTQDRVPLVFLYPPSVIGEIEPVIGSDYQTHVKCLAPTTTYAISVTDFLEIVGAHVPHARLLEAICKKYRSSIEAYEWRSLVSKTASMLQLIEEYIKANKLVPDEEGFYTIDQTYINENNEVDYVLRPRHVGMYSGLSRERRGQIFKDLVGRGAVVYTNEEESTYRIHLTKGKKPPRKGNIRD